jgi:ribosomal protein L7/L12
MAKLSYLLSQLELTREQKLAFKYCLWDMMYGEAGLFGIAKELQGAIDVLENGLDFSKVKELWAEGKFIQAIKEYRAMTGAGLKEAKEAVEGMVGETL